jgi:hypothetical protein
MTSADVAGFLSFGIKDNIDKRLQKESILLYKAGALLCYVYILKCYTNQPIIESMINTTQSLCIAELKLCRSEWNDSRETLRPSFPSFFRPVVDASALHQSFE